MSAISGGWCFTHSCQVITADTRSAAKTFRKAQIAPQSPCSGLADLSQRTWSTTQDLIC